MDNEYDWYVTTETDDYGPFDTEEEAYAYAEDRDWIDFEVVLI